MILKSILIPLLFCWGVIIQFDLSREQFLWKVEDGYNKSKIKNSQIFTKAIIYKEDNSPNQAQ